MNELSNRETALLIFIGIAAIGLLFVRAGRQLAAHLLRMLMGQIGLILALYASYIVGIIALAYWAKLWDFYLVKDTIIWAIFSGLALFWRFADASKEPDFFRKTARRGFEVGLFVEFLLNLESFPLGVEIVLQLFIIFLGVLIAFAQASNQRSAYKLLQGILTIIGLSVIAWTVWQVVDHRDEIDWSQQWRALPLPIYMTIGSLGAIYGIALYSAYENIFSHMTATTGSVPPHWARSAIIQELNFNLRLAGAFTGGWSRKVARSRSFAESRAIVKAFKSARAIVPSARLRAEMEELVSAVHERSIPTSAEYDIAIPASRIEFQSVAAMRSPAWEHRLFAGSLTYFQGVVDSGYGQRYSAGVPIKRNLSKANAGAYLKASMSEMGAAAERLDAALSDAPQEAVFGQPERPADPERIIRYAFRLASIYETFKSQQFEFRATKASPAMRRVMAAAIQYPQAVVDQLAGFIEDFTQQVATLPARIEAGEEITLEFTVAIEFPDGLAEEYNEALDEAADDLAD